MNKYEGELRLLKILEIYTRDNSKQGAELLKHRILSELNKYEKLFLIERLATNKDKGILDKQNLNDIEALKQKALISDNAYCYFLHLKSIAEQGFNQIEVATDTGFKYPTVQEQFEKHIFGLYDF